MSDFLEIRSNEVHEVMNEIPNWIISFGSGIIFVVFSLLFASSFFIEYADVIKEPIVIETNGLSNPVVRKSLANNANDSGAVIGKMSVSQVNFGRIKIGSEVLVKLVAYPFQEHGAILGEVLHIANKTNEKDHRFNIIVLLPADGITTLDKEIPYRSGFLADGEIILNKTTLFRKFIDKIF